MWSYQTPPELSDEQYACWQSLLEARTGLYFSQHKKILQVGLSRRMGEIGIQDFDQYFQQITAGPAGQLEWAQLVDRVSVKATRFFRDPDSFNAVRHYLQEKLSKSVRSSVELWSVGCSTGEEACSLAIIANEVIDTLASGCHCGVIASDISPTALSVARQACYSDRKLAAMAPALINKYFVRLTANDYQLVDRLRQQLCFVQSNLQELASAPAMAVDVIFCQNLLVYFRRERQLQVLDTLVEHLKPGGLLVYGAAEAAGWQHSDMVRYADTAVQAFVKQ